MKTKHYFTFGQVHTANFPLPKGGRLADYYVVVTATENHRERFIEQFTKLYCPSPDQFAYEYRTIDAQVMAGYLPGGELASI